MAGIAKGTVFGGRYIVQSQVGAGGMATVYRGVDNVLDRPVAIKVMLSQYANDPAFAQRFKQEAQAAAALQNPYIVQVYDWGRDEATGTYYIVMEYLRGTDLKTGIRSHGALAPRKVAQIGAQVCSALSVAHAHDIIHRDIKPQNIMIQPNGDAKVMDFGIARAKNSHLTQTNSVLGTAHYVSPEQAQGKELGPTSDLYSLGVVMYEAATGKLPFDGEDAVSVALKQVNQQPVSPSIVNPNVDDNLEAIILRCMAKDPRQRFQNADELRHALNNYINGRPIGVGSAAYGAAATSRMGGSPAPTQVMRPDTSGRIATQRMPQTAGNVAPQRMGQPNYVGAGRGQRGYAATGNTDPRGRAARGGATNNNMVIVITLLAAILIIALIVLGLTKCVSCSPSNDPGSNPGTTIITNPTTVPDLINSTEAEAKSMLGVRNLELDPSITYQVSTTIAKGKIISQNPVEGTEVEKGSKVSIVVSSGTDAIFIPSIVGRNETEAQQLLTGAGLSGVHDASLDGHHATIPAGSILTTDPVNQRVPMGTTIKYGFSLGPDPDTLKVSVPDLYTVPYPLDQALTQLQAVDLLSEVIEEYNEDVEEGHVIRTDPAAGRQVERGTTVKIYLSKGGEPTAIPAYTDSNGTTNWSSASYQSALVNAGFVPNVIEGDPAPSAELAGMVYKTNPAAGSEAAKGSTVDMYVYTAYAPTIPEDVNERVGYNIDNAVTYLRTMGFTNVQVVNVVDGTPIPDWTGYTFSHVNPTGTQSTGAAIYVFAQAPAPTPTACPECGYTEGHATTCSQYVCPECGGSAGSHNSSCSQYVAPACAECGYTSGHATTCSQYVCPECGGSAGSHSSSCSQYVCPECGVGAGSHATTCSQYICPECGGSAGSHSSSCSQYVPPAPVGCAECGYTEGHATTCSQYVAPAPTPAPVPEDPQDVGTE